MSGSLVSVVIPVYNGTRYLGDAIESILRQSHSRLEVIVADDGSTDDSVAVIDHYARRDDRVKPLLLNRGGATRTLNAAIAEARGEWIARLDQDDISLPHRFEVQLAWMRNRSVDVCGGQVMQFEDQSGCIWFPETHEAACTELLFRPAILPSAMTMKAQVAHDNPYLDGVVAGDYELLTRLATRSSLANVGRVLTQWRRHAAQTHVLDSARATIDFTRYRFRYFYELFPDTPPSEYLALARVADRLPFATLSEMDRAGSWLERLADLPDSSLKAKMAKRWRSAWKRSSHLGREGEDLYRQYLLRIDQATS